MNIDEAIAEDNVQGIYFLQDFANRSLEDLCEDINKSIKSLANEYLWHKDEFKLFLPISHSNKEDLSDHLVSSTSFGDNIEDEWFIVHIVLELSKKYKDLVVQLRDSDGDFLLIEAADHLPGWANPETTENRVFIYNNHIHLIPPEIASTDDKLTLKNAMQLVTTYPDNTRVSSAIEKAIRSRVGNYAEKIKDNTHIAAVKVPVDIAALLTLKPNLLAPIVNSYCHRDVIDIKACKNIMTHDDWTTISIKFTKCLYAMLSYSKHNNRHKTCTQYDKQTDLGIKLTHGYQIIMHKFSDIYSSAEYSKFLNSLRTNGYFQNNIEGSNEYNKQLQKAKAFFADIECPIKSSVANEIALLMKSDEYLRVKELLQKGTTEVGANVTEDNDDWLTINPQQLNNFLNSRYGKTMKFKKGDTVTPEAITTELNNFLKQSSDFEGIERNNDHSPDNSIDFNADEFVNSIEKMLNIISSNNEVEETESIDSYFSDGDMSQSEEELDNEIKGKLNGEMHNLKDKKNILQNMITSLQEENAGVGPSSNLLSSVGIDKTALLDSDDDVI